MVCGVQECILVESTRPSAESSLCSGPWNECAYKAVCAGSLPKGLACKAETIFVRRYKRECVCGSLYAQQHVRYNVSSLFPDCFLRVLACLSRLVVQPKRDLYAGEKLSCIEQSLRCSIGSLSRKTILDPRHPYVLHKSLLFLPVCFLQGLASLSCLVVDVAGRKIYPAGVATRGICSIVHLGMFGNRVPLNPLVNHINHHFPC